MKTTNNIQSKTFKQSAITSILVTFVILIALNVVASYFYFRIDLTKDKRHSLSETTIDLLKNLDDIVFIKVYMESDDMPASYQPVITKTREMLEEFSSYTSNIKFEFINPTEDKSKEEINAIYKEFAKKGLVPFPIREQYAAGQSTKYIIPGAMVAYKNHECAALLIEQDYSNKYSLEEYAYMHLEYNLMMAIKHLVQPHKSNVAFIDGHGELDLYQTAWFGSQLGANMEYFYNVTRDSINGRINCLRRIAIEDSTQHTVKDLGNKYDLLVIAQPTKPFYNKDKYAIDQHIMRGGRVLWLIDGTDAALDSLQTASDFLARPMQTRLGDLFFKYGVRINGNLIQDIGSCQAIPISTNGQMMIFPYALNIIHFNDHPITQKITAVRSNFASTIDFVGKDQGLTKTVLATTSDSSKVVAMPGIVSLRVGLAKPNPEEFALQRLPIAVLIEGRFISAFDGILPIEFDTIKQFNFLRESVPTKQIFISDGDIIRNYYDPRSGFFPTGYDVYTRRFYDNTEFLTNCVDYLCDNEYLIELRSKIFRIGLLNQNKIASKTMRQKIQGITIGIPLILVVLIGVVMIFTRRKKYEH